MRLVVLLFALAGCAREDRFECGTPIDSESDVPHRCTGNGERCVCANNGCAFPVHATVCATGFKYREYPFAPKDAAEGCVDPLDVPGMLAVGSHDFCPGQQPDVAAADAALPADLVMSLDDAMSLDGGDR